MINSFSYYDEYQNRMAGDKKMSRKELDRFSLYPELVRDGKKKNRNLIFTLLFRYW